MAQGLSLNPLLNLQIGFWIGSFLGVKLNIKGRKYAVVWKILCISTKKSSSRLNVFLNQPFQSITFYKILYVER